MAGDLQLRRVRDGADELRILAAAAPRWRFVDGEAGRLLVTDGYSLAELRGPWAVNVERYVLAVNRDTGSAMAELLWLISGPGGPTHPRIRDAAEAVVRMMRIGLRR